MDDVCGDIYEKLSALSHYLDRIIDSLEEQAALLFEEDYPSGWSGRADAWGTNVWRRPFPLAGQEGRGRRGETVKASLLFTSMTRQLCRVLT